MNFQKNTFRLAIFLTLIFFSGSDLSLGYLHSSDFGAFAEIPSNSDPEISSGYVEAEALLNRIFLLIVIDFDDFMCMTCLDSFLNFCRSFPEAALEKHAWGILILKDGIDENGSLDNVEIAEKKLRGFINANHIKFPFLIDENRLFSSFKSGGSSVVVFDTENRRISHYSFPIDRKEVLNIKKIFQRN